MKYKNNRLVALRDPVIGQNSQGQPVAGVVLDVNEEKKTIQLSPAIQHPTWIKAELCLHAFDALDVEQEEKPQGGPAQTPSDEAQPGQSPGEPTEETERAGGG